MLRVVVCALLMTLMACSSTSGPEWKAIYGGKVESKDRSKLEIPPDLSDPEITDSVALPNVVAGDFTYSSYSNIDTSGKKVLSAAPRDIKVIRDGKDQWLEVKQPVDKLWADLKIFFPKLGFEIKREDKQLGVMETDWLETKAYAQTGWVSKWLNRILATGLKDKYRVRLEKTPDQNVTRLFFAHQGQKEEATDTSQGETFVRYWITRESDPELEAEMYQRFLVFRDISKTEALKLVEKVAAKERTKIIVKDEASALQVGEGFARTWRRVGIALDRIGLFVDDRNRSSGLYYLRITDDFRDKVKDDEGWLASLFSSKKADLKERYLLSVAEENGDTIVSIYETTGAKADEGFVKQLLTDLKSYLD